MGLRMDNVLSVYFHLHTKVKVTIVAPQSIRRAVLPGVLQVCMGLIEQFIKMDMQTALRVAIEISLRIIKQEP
jgi:hypothetical protein